MTDHEYTWIRSSYGKVPPNAVAAGIDIDGGTLYVGRAPHLGHLLPAKVAPTHGGAFVCYNGLEISKWVYEVLCSLNTTWQYSKNGQVPPNAIVAGVTEHGEKLYAGRKLHQGALTPGRVHPSHGVLYIPFEGKEHQYREYEVLVVVGTGNVDLKSKL